MPGGRRVWLLLGTAGVLASLLAVDLARRPEEVSEAVRRAPARIAPPPSLPAEGEGGERQRTVFEVDEREELVRQNPVAAVPLSALQATVDRPLFSPSRRPPPSPDALSTADTGPAETLEGEAADGAADAPFTLLGVASGSARTIALLRRLDGADVLRVRVGEEIDGWTIEAIAADSITLRRGQETRVLRLFDSEDG